MNSELSYIHSQTHGQEMLRAAQHEHRLDAAQSRDRRVGHLRPIVRMRSSRGWRALAVRRAAVGKA